jgi:DNA-binding transcriptional LysR family regulator
MNIELRQLRYFATVAEELHFGRAARRLHMTQPPLSQTIMALEEMLGAPLFERNRRGVTLTAAGEALLPEARRLLEQSAGLPALVQRAASGASGRLSLAFVSSADYSVLPPTLQAYRAEFPQVEITLKEATSDLQLDDLLEGRVDAGLLIPPLPDRARQELEYLPVLSEPLVLAAPAGLPALARARSADLRKLAGLPLIIFPRHISRCTTPSCRCSARPASRLRSGRRRSRCRPSSVSYRLAWVSHLCHNPCRICAGRAWNTCPWSRARRWWKPAWPGGATMPRPCCAAFWN